MIKLRQVILQEKNKTKVKEFPFNLSVIQNTAEINFKSSVTFFVGENGSGKSTILEALATAVNLPAIGSENIRNDETLANQRRLADKMKLIWNKRTHQGFFLRAEDFFGFTKYMSQLRSEMNSELNRVEDEYQDRSNYARMMARLPYQNALNALKEKYGDALDAYSHGESFLTIFQSRFVPDGLYLLDEPETPLSPQNRLSLLVLLKKIVNQNCQLIIATHSPILMAFPDAVIYSFDNDKIIEVKYEDLEHVQLTRSFLNSPERYFNQLFRGL